jgi:hypothetical protein
MAYRSIKTPNCHEENNRTPDCHSQVSKFVRIAKGLFLLWQNAVHLRAICQEVVPIVANRSIGAQFATTEWNPVPAILHRQSPCSRLNIFFYVQLESVKPIRCRLFTPKLTTNGHSCHTISWHYPFHNLFGNVDLTCQIMHIWIWLVKACRSGSEWSNRADLDLTHADLNKVW